MLRILTTLALLLAIALPAEATNEYTARAMLCAWMERPTSAWRALPNEHKDKIESSTVASS